MQKVTLITTNSLSGILFTNILFRLKIPLQKIYVVSSLRGNCWEKLKKAVSLISQKSLLFLLYRFWVEKVFFQLKLVDKKNLLSLNQIAQNSQISFEHISDVSNAQFISQFSEHQNRENLVLSAYGTQIFPEELIGKIKNFWNVHGSYLPYFQGAAPYFWMRFSQDYPRGVTLHKITKKLDSGPILTQKEINPGENESLFLYHCRCVLEAAEMAANFIQEDQPPPDSSFQNKDLSSSEKDFPQSGLPNSNDMKRFRKAGCQFVLGSDFKKVRKWIVNTGREGTLTHS